MYGGNHLKINCARPTLGTTELRSIYIPLKTYLPKVISSDGTAHTKQPNVQIVLVQGADLTPQWLLKKHPHESVIVITLIEESWITPINRITFALDLFALAG